MPGLTRGVVGAGSRGGATLGSVVRSTYVGDLVGAGVRGGAAAGFPGRWQSQFRNNLSVARLDIFQPSKGSSPTRDSEGQGRCRLILACAVQYRSFPLLI
jgi:hypothetical protein